MRVGQFRHRVTIQRNEQKRSARGEVLDNWITLAKNVPAEVMPLVGREFYQAQQVNTELTHMVKVRYRNELKSQDRIQFRGQTYEVAAPPSNPGYRDSHIELTCKICE